MFGIQVQKDKCFGPLVGLPGITDIPSLPELQRPARRVPCARVVDALDDEEGEGAGAAA